ncbi:MAG: Ig-like domain-containing protein [Promethearchaeota archaeon]
MFSKLKKRRSGQIRAVDFVVSLFLFLLMLSQLILIIFTVQSSIRTNTIETITYEEMDIFGRKLLLEEGDPNWGYLLELPRTFGLADSNLQSFLTLDSAKIARLVTGTFTSLSPYSGFKMYDYSTLKETVGLEREYDFQLGFYPLLEPKITVSTLDFAQVKVTDSYNTPISNAQVTFFTIDLTNGDVISEGSTITDSNGDTSLQLSDPTRDDPEGEHFVFIIVEKGPLWGMNWGFHDPTSETVIIGPSSNTVVWGGGFNSSSLSITDILEMTPESHFLTIIYQTSTSNYLNKTIDLSTAFVGNEIVSIPNEGLVAFFSIAKINDEYRVGIGTYPTILDRDSTNGIFYHIFGKEILTDSIKSMQSKPYPIIVRGTLMRCQLTLWSK